MASMMNNTGQYVPCATYFHDSDCVEYVKQDSFTIYDRVDEFLTLVFDETGKQLVGFKLKGFKNIFTKQLRPIYRLNNSQFLRLVSAIEAICVTLGEQLTADDERQRSYQAAAKMAVNDNVELPSQYMSALAA